MKIETLYEHFINSSGICTDTRKITSNCLFFALKGDSFDGNSFTEQALEKGASKVVIDNIKFHRNTGETILCDDSLSLLQKLAKYHRTVLGIPIIALTGSNGKTTTKELINAVLSQHFKTTATLGNLNNHIGVPLTLLSMTSETEIGIVEMGANHLKEIETLCEIAMPDYGYITNFGKAHLEGFGSLEGVIKGKSELYKHLNDHHKLAFVNGNDPKQIEVSAKLKRYTFGTDLHDCYIQLKDASEMVKVEYDGQTIQSNLIGLYNFHNIAAAIAMGSYFKVPSEKIKKAIENYVPTNNRSQLIKKGKHTIILDAYNANPTSMMAALENFKQASGQNKVLFLGDMFEVGTTVAQEHEAIVRFLSENNFRKAYLIGDHFFNTKTQAPFIQKFKTFEDFKHVFKNETLSENTLLIKASRGMALERILDLL
ncbi:UDP-N-acetylmuramoyl-tripeptide--D-alanyl-D-alanine ligase [Jejudonia soesokkakensis]|uniref:UDP-N-acetylmuramoyl-tripeptide--D-alanyl-D-alanine ligase n=1 Tax=Jejudonia soesokkakensis TaxID=1323432 RepID=A0ABW2MNX5_9FLAO